MTACLMLPVNGCFDSSQVIVMCNIGQKKWRVKGYFYLIWADYFFFVQNGLPVMG